MSVDRVKLEKKYEDLAFLKKALNEVKLKLNARKQQIEAKFGVGNPLAKKFEEDISKANFLTDLIDKYLAVSDDYKELNVLFEALSLEKSLLDEDYTAKLSEKQLFKIQDKIEDYYERLKKNPDRSDLWEK